MIPGFIIAIGTAISSFFGFKGEQAKTIQESISVLGTIDANDAQSVAALANSMSVILSQGSFLERNWRAIFMCICMGILICFWFGYVPPYINKPMPASIGRVFDLLEIGLGGYIVRYGIRDLVKQFQIGSILRTFIEKRFS